MYSKNTLLTRHFSIFKGAIKNIDITTKVCMKTNHMVSTVIDHLETNHVDNEVRSKDPLESVIFSLNLCKVRTFEFHTKKQQIDKYINSLTFKTLAKFDGRTFTGVSDAPKRFTDIDIEVDVDLDKEVKFDLDKEEFVKKCEEISEMCPVYWMLTKAGCPAKVRFNLI